MLTATQVAKYFLSKDNKKEVFTANLVEFNDRKSYEGNIKLNKFLYFAQTVYLAKYGKPLFSDDFIAYDNGPVIKEILENFQILRSKKYNDIDIGKNKDFLDKIYESLLNATCEELIEISHEDEEWRRLRDKTHDAPVMKIKEKSSEYSKKYSDFIEVVGI